MLSIWGFYFGDYYYEIEIDRDLYGNRSILQHTLSTGADAGFKCHLRRHRYEVFLNNQLIFSHENKLENKFAYKVSKASSLRQSVAHDFLQNDTNSMLQNIFIVLVFNHEWNEMDKVYWKICCEYVIASECDL